MGIAGAKKWETIFYFNKLFQQPVFHCCVTVQCPPCNPLLAGILAIFVLFNRYILKKVLLYFQNNSTVINFNFLYILHVSVPKMECGTMTTILSLCSPLGKQHN